MCLEADHARTRIEGLGDDLEMRGTSRIADSTLGCSFRTAERTPQVFVLNGRTQNALNAQNLQNTAARDAGTAPSPSFRPMVRRSGTVGLLLGRFPVPGSPFPVPARQGFSLASSLSRYHRLSFSCVPSASRTM